MAPRDRDRSVGLPCPRGVRLIDLAVVPGLPNFVPVVAAILLEGVFETAIVAEESARNPAFGALSAHLSALDRQTVSHEQFKRDLNEAAVIVRTGECTPYANISLVAGVSF